MDRVFVCWVILIISSVTVFADLPLILILSVYTDFLPSKFCKILIFFLKIGKIQIFPGMRKGFLYITYSHTDFLPKIQIFFLIYTDFVLDQSGRSVFAVFSPGLLSLNERVPKLIVR